MTHPIPSPVRPHPNQGHAITTIPCAHKFAARHALAEMIIGFVRYAICSHALSAPKRRESVLATASPILIFKMPEAGHGRKAH